MFDRPRVRAGLAAAPDHSDPRFMVVWDQRRPGVGTARLTQVEFNWVQLFDGRRTLRDVQVEATHRLGGQPVPLAALEDVARRLDEALFLDGPRLRQHLAGSVREPSCIGCYEGDPEALRRQLKRLFIGPNGPGLPGPPRTDSGLCAALVPHIDYQRGGATFAWGFKEIFEQSNAALFVIIGTSHYSLHRFTLTRQSFQTPLGTVTTDHGYIDRLVEAYGAGLFDDEPCHLPEHSIELEVVFLQYLYEGRRPFRIVPLVVGSFHDCVDEGESPAAKADIARMVAALKQAEAQTPEPVCYLISGDLAHIGPKFGDAMPVGEGDLTHSRTQDEALVQCYATVDLSRYFDVIAAEGDRRRICGLPPTFTTLAAVQPKRGRLLHYDQYVHPRGYESVSFASVAFYR